MRIFFIISLFLFLTAACTKTDDDAPAGPLDELPPATQTGANTFGCLINGEPWYNRGRTVSQPDLSAGYAETIYGPSLGIRAYALNPFIASKRERVYIHFRSPQIGDFLPDRRWVDPI